MNRNLKTSLMLRRYVKVSSKARSSSRPNSKRQTRDWRMRRKSMLNWLPRRGNWRTNAQSWRKTSMTWSSPWQKWKRRNMQQKIRSKLFTFFPHCSQFRLLRIKPITNFPFRWKTWQRRWPLRMRALPSWPKRINPSKRHTSRLLMTFRQRKTKSTLWLKLRPSLSSKWTM